MFQNAVTIGPLFFYSTEIKPVCKFAKSDDAYTLHASLLMYIIVSETSIENSRSVAHFSGVIKSPAKEQNDIARATIKAINAHDVRTANAYL